MVTGKKTFQIEQMSMDHREELAILKHVNSDQQLRLSDVTQEITSLQSRLHNISTERDGLREELRYVCCTIFSLLIHFEFG